MSVVIKWDQAAEFCSNITQFHPSDLTNFKNASFQIDTNEGPSRVHVWVIGIFFVTAISLCAAVGIALMPLLRKKLYSRALTYLVGLGVGSLSGSAIFHLIPQGFELVNEGVNGHKYIGKSFFVIFGVYLFFFVDKLLKIIIEIKKKRQNAGKIQENDTENKISDSTLLNGRMDALLLNSKPSYLKEEKDDIISLDINRQTHGICAHEHNMTFRDGDNVIATVAWMIIFGDGLHNLIDGLSIGISFSQSILGGIGVSVAVLCEEFPHELGDVAILVSAGMTLRQALVYNVLSALSCYVGFAVGVLLGNIDAQLSAYIFALAGGMFLYISLASMVPEMNRTMEVQMEIGIKQGLLVLLLQASGVLTGLLAMYIMADYGGQIQFA